MKIMIEIDGGVNPETAPKMIKAGADILVCGTSAIFKSDFPVDKNIKEFRKTVTRKLK